MQIQRRGKYGRSKLPTADLRKWTIGVRVNAAELADMRGKAAAVGLPLAQWLRIIGVSSFILSPLVPAINRQSYAELARLAGNLNQLARAAHAGKITVAPNLLEAIGRQVQLLRKELLGVHRDCEIGQR